jgi:hypothetical protein
MAVTRDECDRLQDLKSQWSRASADAPQAGGGSEKQQLAKLIVRCGYLDGRSETDVRNLLGEPTEATATMLEYEVGPEPGSIQLDSEFLQVSLNQSHEVARAKLSS